MLVRENNDIQILFSLKGIVYVMVLISSSKVFILSILFSGLVVSGLIMPSFAASPVPSNCGNCNSLLMQSNSSPLKQFKAGIPLTNIFCKPTLVLVFKISNGSPACMKSETAQKLAERGWGVLNEQTVWFEFTPIQCQKTPWATWSMNFSRVGTEAEWIKWYFKDQGIIIIDARYTPSMDITQSPVQHCGEPIKNYAFYLLVSESDINKMTSLGYKEVDNIPSSAHTVG